ncbi:MAG: hypothetical protein EXR85_00630 [Xanthomonadales bacterium]|nr:hypothetical protein [Xanthomonadales bacterium]
MRDEEIMWTMMNEKACWKDIIAFGGAIMAFVIGAGFATGWEVMQFFTHLGLWRSLGAGAVAMVVFAWFGATLLKDGRRLQLADPNMIFAHYCGKWIGLFFEWFVPALLFLVVSIMLSGAGATVSKYYGADANIGRIGMAIATLLTVLLGLKKLVHIIGAIGPVIITFTICMGLTSIVVYDKQVPSLAIAASILPFVASVFAVMLLAAMYTTAVPMLWTACNRITSDENSKKYKIGALLMIIISCFGGQLKFGTMVGTVYPATGYMGLLLIAGMIYTKYLRKSREEHQPGGCYV